MATVIHTALDADGVLTATIDMPNRTMNVFSVELMDALDALMDRVDADAAVRSVVLTSGKPTFLAGADLVMVRGYCDAARTLNPEQMFQLCGRLGRQFVRLEASSKPWVAAVNGLALGGGLELAMACRVRLVTDDARVQLGVPEVRWGLLPGAGGTQRLPRLVGFDAAMNLLLSGRSAAPEEAVRIGLFARAVPADRLMDEAKAAARAMHGEALNPAAKFAHLAQADVPAPDAATARAVALRHGIGSEMFDQYPAHRAIVNSVLQGARLPLAEATAVEMHQFLGLMFDPVAGNMVRTLFLERLRAERELAAPAGMRLEHINVGRVSLAHQAWIAALVKLKLPQTPDERLPPDTLELFDANGQAHRVALGVLESDHAPGLPLMVLSPAGAYGRVLEIVGADDATAALAAALAARLWCLPWRTPGPGSVLRQLRARPLPEQAQVAVRCAARAGAGDPAFLDVAACLAGVTPAWSGGPLTWAWAHPEAALDGANEATEAAWAAMQAPGKQATCA